MEQRLKENHKQNQIPEILSSGDSRLRQSPEDRLSTSRRHYQLLFLCAFFLLTLTLYLNNLEELKTVLRQLTANHGLQLRNSGLACCPWELALPTTEKTTVGMMSGSKVCTVIVYKHALMYTDTHTNTHGSTWHCTVSLYLGFMHCTFSYLGSF